MIYESLIQVVESLQQQIRHAKTGRAFDVVEYHCCIGILLERLPEVENALVLAHVEAQRERSREKAQAEAMKNTR